MVKTLSRISLLGIESLVKTPEEFNQIGKGSFYSSCLSRDCFYADIPDETRGTKLDVEIKTRRQFLELAERFLEEKDMYLCNVDYRRGVFRTNLKGLLYERLAVSGGVTGG